MSVRAFEYVAILHAKRGEVAALRDLPTSVFDSAMVLLEVPARLQAWSKDCKERLPPKRSLQQHLDGISRRLQLAFEGRPTIWLDLPHLFKDEHRLTARWHPIDELFDQLGGVGVAAVPVTGPDRPTAARIAAGRVAREQRRGAVLRIPRAHFRSILDRPKEIETVVSMIGQRPEDIDLLIDVGAIGEDLLDAMVIASSNVLSSPQVQARRWRSITLASGAFPESVREIEQGLGAIVRVDLLLWEAVCARMPHGARRPVFGDYGIQAPGYSDVPPNATVSANIRYTAGREWLVARGRPVRGRASIVVPLEEYRGLAQVVCGRPEFSGAKFSPGDRALADVASGREASPGTPETWRRHGTSHHVAFAAAQMAGVALPVGAGV